MPKMPQIIASPPIPSVNDNRHRMRPLAVRQMQFAKLKLIVSVIEMHAGRGRRYVEDALRRQCTGDAEQYAS
jgi:hypothetical protein